MVRTIIVIQHFSQNQLVSLARFVSSQIPDSFPFFIETGLHSIEAGSLFSQEPVAFQHPFFENRSVPGFFPETDSLIFTGEILAECIQHNTIHFSLLSEFGNPLPVLKRIQPFSFSDAAAFLAHKLNRKLHQKRIHTAIVEIRGKTQAMETGFALQAIQILAEKNNATVKHVLVPEAGNKKIGKRKSVFGKPFILPNTFETGPKNPGPAFFEFLGIFSPNHAVPEPNLEKNADEKKVPCKEARVCAIQYC